VAPPSRSGSRPLRALAALAVLVLIMLISITGKQTFSPGNWSKQFKVGLGLDLSSGTQVVLQAATKKGAPSAGAMQQAISVLESRVNGTGNSGAQVQQISNDLIVVTVPGKAATSVIDLISSTAKLSFRPVLLTQPYGSTQAVPQVVPSTSPSGTASPTTTPSGSATSSASTSPTAKASATASSSTSAKAAGSTASPKASTADVAARAATSPTATPSKSATPAASATPKTSATPTATATPTTSGSATATPTAAATPSTTSTAVTSISYGDPSKVTPATQKLFDKMVCKPGVNANTVDPDWKNTIAGYTPNAAPWDTLTQQIVSCDANGTKYVLGPAVFDGTQVTAVSVNLNTSSGQYEVDLTLDGRATSAFATLTENQANTYLPTITTNQDSAALDETAIVLDGNVQSAPQTQGAIPAGNVSITGPQPAGFTQDQANQLGNILKYGSLPLSFTQQQVNNVSPQLGHDSLVAGLFAGVLGLLLVVIYMFYYYRGLGLVSVSSLLIAGLLSYLAVVILSRYQNFTMSLSAIAGLVVAIGITADSFIVYFERLRDEVRDGKTLRPAVEAGWKRARRTILVSDTVSFIAAVLLYHFAVSDVQGFAYTLGLTTLIDVLVVFLFTKPMVTLLANTKFFGGGHKWSGLDPERLGAKAPWRGAARRTVRTQRPPSGRPPTGLAASPSKEA
jgi:preprotein translocase subunit SecD